MFIFLCDAKNQWPHPHDDEDDELLWWWRWRRDLDENEDDLVLENEDEPELLPQSATLWQRLPCLCFLQPASLIMGPHARTLLA